MIGRKSSAVETGLSAKAPSPSKSGKTPLFGRLPSRPALAIAIAVISPLAATGPAFSQQDARYSGRLGVYYKLVSYRGAYAARLVADPVPGSPLLQEQIQLEKGDVITHLDRVPITKAAELERHRGKTAVQFINVRNDAILVRNVYLPAMNARPVPADSPRFVETSVVPGYSPRLGIYYELVRYGRAYGARLKSNPVPGSPLLQEQIRLEAGDLITHLDGTPINGPKQLENHHGRTLTRFKDVRTGDIEARWVFLPSMRAPGLRAPAQSEERRQKPNGPTQAQVGARPGSVQNSRPANAGNRSPAATNRRPDPIEAELGPPPPGASEPSHVPDEIDF